MPRIFEFTIDNVTVADRAAFDLDRVVSATSDGGKIKVDFTHGEFAELEMNFDDFLAAWKLPGDLYAERIGRMKEIEAIIELIDRSPGATQRSILDALHGRHMKFMKGEIA